MGADIDALEQQFAETQAKKSELRKQGIFGSGPMRFFVPKGGEANLLILDTSFKTLAISEHNLKDAQGNWGLYEPCIKAIGNCPICEKHTEGYVVLFLSVLDLTPYHKKDPVTRQPTGEVIQYTRKLLPIKLSQLRQWRQLVETPAIEEYGTLRGCFIKVRRDMGEKSAGIGVPVPVQGTKMLWVYSEQEMVQHWGHEAERDRSGQLVIERNGKLQPFPYDILFPEPDKDDIIRRYGSVGIGHDSNYHAEFNQGNGASPPPQRGSRSAPPPPGMMQPQGNPGYTNAPPQQSAPAYNQPPQNAYPTQPPQQFTQGAPPAQQGYAAPQQFNQPQGTGGRQLPQAQPTAFAQQQPPAPQPTQAPAPVTYAPAATEPDVLPPDDELPFGGPETA